MPHPFVMMCPGALSACGKLCYNRAAVPFNLSGLQEQHWENP